MSYLHLWQLVSYLLDNAPRRDALVLKETIYRRSGPRQKRLGNDLGGSHKKQCKQNRVILWSRETCHANHQPFFGGVAPRVLRLDDGMIILIVPHGPSVIPAARETPSRDPTPIESTSLNPQGDVCYDMTHGDWKWKSIQQLEEGASRGCRFCERVARQWLLECVTTHEECGHEEERPAPSRLLDVTPDDGGDVRIVEIEGTW